MIPFRLTQAQFAERFRRSLDRASPRAIALLRAHFTLQIDPGVDSADVQLFIGDDDPQALSAWIYYVGQHNKVDARDPSLHAGRSLELALGLEDTEAFDSRFFTNEEFGGLDIAANALKAWFAECWWKAGGWGYGVPVSLGVHDGHGDGKSIKLTER